MLTRRSLLAAAAAQVRLPRKLRLAMIGFDGHPGEITAPLPRLPDIEVAAISDPDPAVLDRQARNPRLASARRYADYRTMLEREQLDLLAVNNSNGARAAAVLAGLERKLHVIAEKPLALTRGDLEAIVQARARAGVQIGMLLPMRFSPPYLALRQLVASGAIGEAGNVSAQKSYKAGNREAWMRRRASYGGTIPWIGIHMFDLMRWASGREFTEAFSFDAQVGPPPGIGEMENTTGTLFRLDNGGVATLHMDYYRPDAAPTHGDDRLRIAGTKGVAEYTAATGVTLLAGKFERIEKLPEAQPVFIDFVDAVFNGKPTALPFDDIYRVCRITLAAEESARRGQLVRV
ncbi:MAG: Gfo/Idh/MocA family protein [Bryobacteraceae bacterium]